MNNAFFFQTKQIPENSTIFDQFKQQNIFFSYFQVDQNCYLFFYAQKSIDIQFLYQSLDVIQELDSKQRKIRSLRGFFLYALEIIENAQDYEILSTNLQPFFWKKVKNIIRQNKKGALLEFLFGSDNDRGDSFQSLSPSLKEMEKKIKNLQNQVTLLQQKVINLEAKLDNSKYPLSDALEASKSPLKPLSGSNISYNQKKQQNQSNFRTLGKILEDEQIEIIKLGFQLQAEGKISLKKYYESTDPYSLFQSKGYKIKYESIRRTKLYQQLKFQL